MKGWKIYGFVFVFLLGFVSFGGVATYIWIKLNVFVKF